jgi:glycosyltransferase involved in cell wall biosynthesis
VRVGLVTDFYYPWIGGPSTLIRNLARGLSARGHVVSMLAPSMTRHPVHTVEGVVPLTRVRTIPSPVGFRLRVALWPRPEIARWMRQTEPDVIHVHHPFPISATAIFTARRRGIPVVATNHTIPECSLWGLRTAGTAYDLAEEAFGRWITFLLNRCDRVTTPTRTAADRLRELGYGRPIEPISNGVDTERFRPGESDAALARRLGLDDRPVVLYTGRLDAEKQMDVWLRAGAEVVRSGPTQLVVGGNGGERWRLEALAHDLGIGSSVRFIGYLPDGEYAQVYRLAAVYLITSPVELQSITALEAMASGLPVVAVDAGALPEVVGDRRNGYLVRPGDWAAAADRISILLADDDLRARMGAESRSAALQHDLQKSIDAYERFIVSTAQQARGERHFGRVPASGG